MLPSKKGEEAKHLVSRACSIVQYSLTSQAAPWIIILLSTALFFIFGLQSLTGEKLLYTYPHLTSDSYDWLVQSEHFYRALLLGKLPLLEIPILRQFGFQISLIGDHIFGSQGYVLLLLQTCFFFVLLSSFRACMQLHKVTSGVQSALLFYFASHPLVGNFFVILAELQAMAFMYLGLAALFRYSQNERRRDLIVASLCFLAGAYTKTYVLIPLLVYGAYEFLFGQKRHTRFLIPLVAAAVSLLFVIGEFLWHVSIPHADTPKTFGYLRLSTHIPLQLLDSLTLAFFPFVLLIIWAVASGAFLRIPLVIAFMSCTAMALVALYTAWDSRFFLIFFPLLLLMCAILWSKLPKEKEIHRLVHVGTFGLICFSVFFLEFPSLITLDYRRQHLVAPNARAVLGIGNTSFVYPTWYRELYAAKWTTDRFRLKELCGGTKMCWKARAAYTDYSPYQHLIMKFHFQTLREEKKQAKK
jgi:hypothetical protein